MSLSRTLGPAASSLSLERLSAHTSGYVLSGVSQFFASRWSSSWVAHSQEVLSTISRARLEPASLQNQVWAYRSSRDPALPLKFSIYLQNLTVDIQQLRRPNC